MFFSFIIRYGIIDRKSPILNIYNLKIGTDKFSILSKNILYATSYFSGTLDIPKLVAYEILFIFSGLVLGGLIGELTKNINGLWWLGYGQNFGLENPLVLNLSIVTLTFALMFKINVASIVGMIIAIVIYKKAM